MTPQGVFSPACMPPFDHAEAFSRNIGWLTRQEQDALRHKRVAIAGLGGVGGVHLLTLCRLGIGQFHLADFDRFDLANFNRQAGATVSTLGQSKLDVMIRQAREINPGLEIRGFSDGVTADNLGAFLDGVDLYMDGLDFFVGGNVVLISPCGQQKNLLETLELAVRETQDVEPLVLASQVTGDLRQAQDALGDDKSQYPAAHQLGRGGFQESEFQPLVFPMTVVIIRWVTPEKRDRLVGE